MAWQPKRKAPGKGATTGGTWRRAEVPPVPRAPVVPERPPGAAPDLGRRDPPAAGRIGRRVTSKKARMWNDLYLSEVNFWRDFLSDGRPDSS